MPFVAICGQRNLSMNGTISRNERTVNRLFFSSLLMGLLVLIEIVSLIVIREADLQELFAGS
jgi:hypothetical protein